MVLTQKSSICQTVKIFPNKAYVEPKISVLHVIGWQRMQVWFYFTKLQMSEKGGQVDMVKWTDRESSASSTIKITAYTLC